MSLIWCNAAVWTVALLYLFWKARQAVASRRHQIQRQRVAYMLWVMAERLDGVARGSGQFHLTPR